MSRILQSSPGGFFTLFVISSIAALIVYCCRFFCCDNGQPREDPAVIAARRREIARAAAAPATATAITVDQLVDGMTPEDRKIYVANFLRTEKMTKERILQMADDSTSPEMGTSAAAAAVTSPTAQEGGSMISDSGIGSTLRDGSLLSSMRGPHCSICLERLRAGEELGMAQNPDCRHLYHKECISEWLLLHKECPLCKQNFLSLPPSAEDV